MIDSTAKKARPVRRDSPKESLDFFPTPLWATRALLEHTPIDIRAGESVLEPACGQGHMSEALTEYGLLVESCDIENRGYGRAVDFLSESFKPDTPPDWIVTNPPFNRAEDFIFKGLSLAESGVAMLLRSAFLEGVGRQERLFFKFPPAFVAQFSERVPLAMGRIDPKASAVVPYSWFVWQREHMPPKKSICESGNIFLPKSTKLTWIPPCKKELTRESDSNTPTKHTF